ncbi:HesB/IscA family protein [Sulfurirhabdus autotrophica]|uniref:Iron-sulfur cluster assembly protein n=1 Tax=Sulfurirhabdus autotrophica TaxID=1706046 RepID=A0A4R3Y4I3_9PROT|nr:iron-sulfur cluster assembly accessory protein [Sulfurirhabdus autotrophica]TCV86676.1 iron-sulfur cluster assembly protein [Sulfurirhabdus autotrophica]
MITVTPGAAEQIRLASEQTDAVGLPLRIAAKYLADGSMQYGMGFDEIRENDHQVISEGVSLLVSANSEMLLNGTVVDFVELNPGEFQFIFINPNDTGVPPAKKQGGGCGSGGCGTGSCGSSSSSGGGCA